MTWPRRRSRSGGRCGPASLVVVRPTLDLPGPQGQQRMGPVEGLDLRLLVDREHQRVVGRVEVELKVTSTWA